MSKNNGSGSLWPKESKGFCDLHENVILWYGRPKIGKTTLAANFPDALIIDTEPERGTKHVKAHIWTINSWLQFCGYVNTIQKNIKDCPFSTIIIDTVDWLSDYCVEFTCEKLGVQDLGDAGFGKGYAAYSREFKKQITALMKLGLGVCFISHAESKPIPADTITNPLAMGMVDPKNNTVDITAPSMEKRARKLITGLADIIMLADVNKDKERVLYTQPTVLWEAGDRTGRLPEVLPLNYNELVKAYYGDGAAVTELRGRIQKALNWLSENKVDGFDVGKRKAASVEKHLGTDGLKSNNIVALEAYLHHLKIIAKDFQNNNKKEKTDGE